MKVLIDIGHPAHVHYFKNFIYHLINSGNEIKIIARDKEVTFELLDSFKLNFISRGKGGKTFFEKIIYFPYAIIKFIYESYKFKPDFFLSFASPYLPFSSLLFGKPLITIDDTENDKLTHTFYKPISSLIITPLYFKKNLGKKHIKINTIFELGSLHPEYYNPDKKFLEEFQNERYALIRFVEWNATHDLNEEGFSSFLKNQIVEEISKHMKIYISSEGELPKNLRKYKIQIPPSKIHDFLYNADIFIGDSGTMAVESAILGTPSIFFSSLAKKLGNFISLRNNYSLLVLCDDENKLLNLSLKIIRDKKSKEIWVKRAKNFVKNKINFTEFLLWTFNKYPDSKELLLKKKNINNF